MGQLLTKVILYDINGNLIEDISSYVISLTCRKSKEPKNNQVDLKIHNPNGKFSSLDGTGPPFVTSQVLKIYAKIDTDNTGLDTSSDSVNLLMVADITEVGCEGDENKEIITISGVDRTFVILNRLSVGNYRAGDTNAPNGEGWNSPESIQNIIHNVTDQSIKPASELFTILGTMGGIYEIDARLFTEGIKQSGTATSTSSYKLIDGSATFQTNLVKIGDWVYNSTDREYATVKSVDSEIQLTLYEDMIVSGESYSVSGGFIQHKRPNLGTSDTNTALFPGADVTNFPFVSLGKSYKPAYDLIDDLSQYQNTNTINESNPNSAFKIVVQRAMIYYVDEKNRFHWFYPNTSPTILMATGSTTAINPDTNIHYIHQFKLKKSVYDITNFIVFRAGTDINGAQILGYFYDETSGSPILKDSYRPFVSIAERMKEADYIKGNLQRGTTGDQRYYNFPAGYPVTPDWDPSSRPVANNNDYNENFREVATYAGQAWAKSIINKRMSPRWKGSITLQGEIINPADLIRISISKIGLTNKDLRVIDVDHSIDKSGWKLTLNVEEDEPELEV